MNLSKLNGKKKKSTRLVVIFFICLLGIGFEARSTSFSFRAGRGVLWTWVGGTQTGGSAGTYGTKGTPSTSNIPPARGYGCADIDPSGDAWVFGGSLGSNTTLKNDLWRFRPSTGEWTWMSGSSGSAAGNTNAVYGTKGTPSVSNTPGERKELACWTDSLGNFWVFSGLISGSTNINDLWRFKPSTLEWTWMSGSNTTNAASVFGTKGTEAAGNVPSGRERTTYWKDSSDNLWFYGGYDDAASGRMGDLWRYRTSTGMWTWMSGSNTKDVVGVFGTKNTPSTSNFPGARRSNRGAVDSNGNFWFYGGDGLSNVKYSDLWKYDPTTNEWTWTAGPSASGQAGVYGTKLVANSANNPKARSLGLVVTSLQGDISVTMGYDGTGELNDFSMYSPASGNWTWLSGSSGTNAANTYGTINIPGWTNSPSGRDGMLSWIDATGALWIFGGYDAAYRNDLWKGKIY
ncbi:hypothetical protein BH10BDE1_BH10BDE1_04390 [soil metagenome]